MHELFIHTSVVITPNKLICNGVDFTYQPKSTEIKARLKEVYQFLEIDYRKFFKMDELSKLGFIASELLLSNKNIPASESDVALVFCNRSSSLFTDSNFEQSLSAIPSPAIFVYTLPNIVMGEICIRNGFKGENAFFVQPEWDIDFSIDYIRQLFQTTSTRFCLAGWLEVESNDNFEARLILVSTECSENKLNENYIYHLNNY